jgi:hypothetical protein
VRVHQISYNDLVDRTGDVCRGICEFLGVEFDEKMIDLKHADLSSVYDEPQHEHLRRRVIERQKFSDHDLVPPDVAAKLVRFRNRWERLSGTRFGPKGALVGGSEPGGFEKFYHRTAGAVLTTAKSANRIAFEFLPLTWLRTYRLFKAWYRDGHLGREPGLGRQIVEHWPTITASFAFLAGVGVADVLTGPDLTMAAFYALPAMALALIVNRGWGSLAAVVSAITWSAVQFGQKDLDFSVACVLGWNSVMRFTVLEIMVLLLDRIRRELRSRAVDRSQGDATER